MALKNHVLTKYRDTDIFEAYVYLLDKGKFNLDVCNLFLKGCHNNWNIKIEHQLKSTGSKLCH